MELKERVEKILEEKVRPILKQDGGDLKLVDIDGDCVIVEYLGACRGCPSAELGTKDLILEELSKEIPEIQDVEIDHTVSPELMDFAKKILNHEI